MLRKGWVTRVYVARFVFWLEVEVVVEEGDWLFGGQGQGRAFRLSTSLTFSRPHSYSQINSLFDEARHRVGHDFDVSGFHEGWKCGIYGLTCEGHDLSTLDSSYREDM
jgi:hypothetical protein